MNCSLIILALLASAASAHAADLPSLKGEPTPPILPWQPFGGAYVGLQASAMGMIERTQVTSSASGANLGSVTAGAYDYGIGARAGYDWLNGNFLYGVLGDVNASLGSVSVVGKDPSGATNKALLGSQETIRGRAGYVFGSLLLYGTAGVALGDARHHYISTNATGTTYSAYKTYYNVSPIVSVGAEYALTKSWSVGAEYSIRGAENWKQLSPVNPATNIHQTANAQTATLLLNYHF